MGISSSGLISGINFDNIVTQLMAIERQPEQKLATRQQAEETKLASLLDIKMKLSSFKFLWTRSTARQSSTRKRSRSRRPPAGTNC